MPNFRRISNREEDPAKNVLIPSTAEGPCVFPASQRSLPAVLVALLIFVALNPQLYKPLNQIWVFQSTRRPHLGIHADGGEPRHGVDLVQIDLSRFGIHQEIDAGKT